MRVRIELEVEHLYEWERLIETADAHRFGFALLALVAGCAFLALALAVIK